MDSYGRQGRWPGSKPKCSTIARAQKPSNVSNLSDPPYTTMYNNNIFKKICHDHSGQEFDLGYIEEGTFIETLSLDGPKLLLTMIDPYSYLR